MSRGFKITAGNIDALTLTTPKLMLLSVGVFRTQSDCCERFHDLVKTLLSPAKSCNMKDSDTILAAVVRELGEAAGPATI